MSLKSNIVYISIESRKGGVGKTTAALTLAETMLKENYQVLIVDMDIIGTTLDASFIDANKELIHEVKWNGKTANIAYLFKNIYMLGKSSPIFASEEKNNTQFLTFSLGKCNYLGSNIYDESQKLLEDPRILYDAFHAFWLLEFVKIISKSFSTAVGPDYRIAVILDNSPGLSSIESVIHDYLTDLGPEKGKILLVSTIDPQDLKVCRHSKQIIERLFKDKVDAGKYYRTMTERGEGERKDTPAFNSVWNSLCASDGKHPEYHSGIHERAPQYVSILVNKVPQSIYEQLFTKGILHRDSEMATSFQNHLLYYFSNPQLIDKGISYQQSYMERFDQYKLSGNVVDIENDDKQYLNFCKISRQNGMGNFFKEEWAPLANFRNLNKILEEQGVIKKHSNARLILYTKDFKENSISNIVSLVEKYVISNLLETTQLKRDLPSVVKYVSSVLGKIDGEPVVDFHPEQPRLQEIEEFVTSFGLTVYGLHIYKQVCIGLNMLIKFCLENVEHLEKINKDSFISWFADVLEGRVAGQDISITMARMLDDRANARELSNALKKVIKLWEL